MKTNGFSQIIRGLSSAVKNIFHKYVTGDANLIRMKKALNIYRANAIVKGMNNININTEASIPLSAKLIKKIEESGEHTLTTAQWIYHTGIKGLNVNNTRSYTEKEIILFEAVYGGETIERNEFGKLVYTEAANFNHMILDLLTQKGFNIFDPHQLSLILHDKTPAELYNIYTKKAKWKKADYGIVKQDPVNWIRKTLGLKPETALEMEEKYEIYPDIPDALSLRRM